MIISNEAIQSSISGTDFKIKASAKAFKILSNNLYQDKPLAICRELICNAIDSHTAAGKATVPVEITVPSSINPNLIVEDFGLGLSREEVEQIYTTYFESTKSNSNELVGGLGLGSKSPFAYTQSFSVIARKDGVENTFIAFIGANGMPQINCLNTTTTDKCNSVRVEVPVAQADSGVFHNALRKLQWFDVMPTVHGWNEPIMQQHPAFERLQNDGFAFVNTGYYGISVYAVMGNVAYPVDTYQVNGLQEEIHNLTDYVERTELFIRFNIGQLDITPGREDLSYDPDTQEAIRVAVNRVFDTTKATVAAISTSDSPLNDKLARLKDAGINNPACSRDIIGSHVWRYKPDDENFKMSGRVYNKPYGRRKMSTLVESFVPDRERDNDFLWFYYHNRDAMFIESNDGHSISHCVRAVMDLYDTTSVIEIPQMTAEQREYFDNVFGQLVHLASDVKEAVKEHRKANKSTTTSTKSAVKHTDDRIVVDGDPVFLSEHSPDTLKFVTDVYYIEFYKALYPSARIAKVSNIYKGKIERNGFEFLDCDRKRVYTEEESFQIENNVASAMTKDEYARLVANTVCCHLGSSHWDNWGRSYNDELSWFYHKALVDHFADKLAVDTPDNLDYNTVNTKIDIDSIPSTVLWHISEKYRDAVIEKLRRVTIDNPILYLVSSRHGRDNIQIVLDTLAKLKGK